MLSTMQTDEPVFQRPLWGEPVRRRPSGLVPSRRPLEGSLVRLEPLNPATHAEQLHEASHGGVEALKIWDFLPFGPWPTPEAFRAWLDGCAASFDYIWYAFRERGDDRVRGMACYLDIQPAQGVIEIGGIWFAPGMQRTRAATEALFLLLDHAMGDLAYRRMQWRCNALNERSRRAARRLGFRFEGVFHNHMIVEGRNRDTAWYSMLDGDWPVVRDILAAWLRDDNFDADGRQKTSLVALMSARAVPERG